MMLLPNLICPADLPPLPEFDADGVLRLRTSGTTGAPKVVEHTWESLTAGIKPRATEYVWGLLYDPATFAGVQVILTALFGWEPLVWCEGPLDRKLDAFLEHGVTALSATPSIWRRLLMDPRARRLRLKQVTLGGEIADQPILDALRKAFPDARITHIYASTEAGVVFAVHDGMAGFPVDYSTRPRGVLCVGGEYLCVRTVDGPWIDTGDRVRRVGDRWHFVGRADDRIDVGGAKVFPAEVEAVVRGVEGVIDCRAYGIQAPMLGHVVGVDVVGSHPDLRLRVQRACALLPRHAQPARVRVVASLDLTSAGKIARAA